MQLAIGDMETKIVSVDITARSKLLICLKVLIFTLTLS